MSDVSRPVLKYFGAKWELAPWILSQMPPHRSYVEPFGGGASVLLRKPRSHTEVYNDLDGEIVNVFRVIRDRPGDLESALEATPFSRDEYLSAFEEGGGPVECARKTIVRSFMGFAGSATHGAMTGFRSRSINSGTHPAGQWANYSGHLPAFAARMRGVVIENRDAREVMRLHDCEDTLFFVDPPYLTATRGAKNQYRHEMTDAQHEDLCVFLQTLKGMVMLCGYHNPVYDRLGWQVREQRALADGARERTEVLWLNPACVQASTQMSLFSKASPC